MTDSQKTASGEKKHLCGKRAAQKQGPETKAQSAHSRGLTGCSGQQMAACPPNLAHPQGLCQL